MHYTYIVRNFNFFLQQKEPKALDTFYRIHCVRRNSTTK